MEQSDAVCSMSQIDWNICTLSCSQLVSLDPCRDDPYKITCSTGEELSHDVAISDDAAICPSPVTHEDSGK